MLRSSFQRLQIFQSLGVVPFALGVALCLSACGEDLPVEERPVDDAPEPAQDDDDALPTGRKDAGRDTRMDAAAPRVDASTGAPASADAGAATAEPEAEPDAAGAWDAGAVEPSGPDAGSTTDAAVGKDAGSPVSSLPKCMSGSTEACGTFVTATGTEIPLGSYGAAMDVNVGKGFENRVNLLDTDAQCESFAIQGFGGSREEAALVSDSKGLDLKLYTVYRPAQWVEGETYPIVSWGNGTCAKPEGYGALLRYVASRGYIVVAANSRWVGSGTPQTRGIDFLVAANADAKSPYYKRVDTSKVAAMGHSQGGQGTIAAASDDRIDTVIIFNGGVSADKPFLAISGDRDVTADLNTTNLQKGIDGAEKAAWLFFHKIPERGQADGHLTLMTQPERVTEPTVAWLSYLLSNDAESKEWLVGPNCKLCTQPDEFEYGQKGL
jgi:Chlorophyllase enzyme